MKLVPTYQHDCDRCTFVASVAVFDRIVDIWVSCSEIGDKSYIVRYSSEGSDYSTTSPMSHLIEAKRYTCSYSKNPGGTILHMTHFVCEAIEKKVLELTDKE